MAKPTLRQLEYAVALADCILQDKAEYKQRKKFHLGPEDKEIFRQEVAAAIKYLTRVTPDIQKNPDGSEELVADIHGIPEPIKVPGCEDVQHISLGTSLLSLMIEAEGAELEQGLLEHSHTMRDRGLILCYTPGRAPNSWNIEVKPADPEAMLHGTIVLKRDGALFQLITNGQKPLIKVWSMQRTVNLQLRTYGINDSNKEIVLREILATSDLDEIIHVGDFPKNLEI